MKTLPHCRMGQFWLPAGGVRSCASSGSRAIFLWLWQCIGSSAEGAFECQWNEWEERRRSYGSFSAVWQHGKLFVIIIPCNSIVTKLLVLVMNIPTTLPVAQALRIGDAVRLLYPLDHVLIQPHLQAQATDVA
jgi:hypothetical protein